MRLLADEGWASQPFSLMMLVVRHSPPAQIWLLDYYVQSYRKEVAKFSHQFLAMPLKMFDSLTDSGRIIDEWKQRGHIWVRGNSGMGKTTIFKEVIRRYFRQEKATAFSLFKKFGFILIPIEARKFAGISGNEREPFGWMLDATARVMQERGFSFTERNLVEAMFRSGTLALAIDGLNEVGYSSSVSLFAQAFPGVPLFITSQDSAGAPFVVARLPSDIKEHSESLMRLYLGSTLSGDVIAHIQLSGLESSLQSGYDVMLVVDLARASLTLPRTRTELYTAFITAAWPDNDDRLPILRAAAWKLMSRNGINEDKRRLVGGVDAPADLLQALSDAQIGGGKSVRLVRPTGSAFEFVHDQMSAFLAACWLAFNVSDISELVHELEESDIWREGTETQKVVWEFLAALIDRSVIEALWLFSAEENRRVVLRRAVEERALKEDWPLILTRSVAKV